jgi:hypothetical protein
MMFVRHTQRHTDRNGGLPIPDATLPFPLSGDAGRGNPRPALFCGIAYFLLPFPIERKAGAFQLEIENWKLEIGNRQSLFRLYSSPPTLEFPQSTADFAGFPL